MAILKNSIIVAFWTMASRGLGFARDLLIANKLGATGAADAFFIALMLPNLLRRLFGEGAFNIAFVPILARHKGKSDAAALEFASAAFSWLLVIVSVVTLIGIFAMPALVAVMASGWLDQPEKFALTVELGRITFPYLGLITIAAFLGAMCNTFGQFAAFAMVPAFLNLSILICLFALPGFNVHPAQAAAWAIPLGGIGQVAYMWWAARRLNLRLTFHWFPRHKDLKPLLYRIGPAAVGVGVLQLSLIIDNQVASFLSNGAISYLQYANRFYQLPLALIGIAVATVLLPHLAVLLGEGNRKEATRSFTDALAGCLTLALGATVGLLLLAPEMMMTLLKHGVFSVADSYATAWAMMAYVLGLPAYILTKVTAPAFFASEDPASPVKAGAYALLVNFLINVAFVIAAKQWGFENIAHVGIALSTAIGGYVNAALQWRWLNRRGILDVDAAALWKDIRKMLAVAALVALAIGSLKFAVPYSHDWNLMLRIGWLGLTMGLGLAVFVAGVEYAGLVSFKSLLAGMRNRRKSKLKGGQASGADF